MAVQLAKYYGAKNIIATGRNKQLLSNLLEVGATKVVSLKHKESDLEKELEEIHKTHSIDVVIDYLWGKPIELILNILKKDNTNYTSIIRVGEMAGSEIALSSGTLRSTNIQLLGSGIGSLSLEDMNDYQNKVLPEVFELAAAGKVKMDIQAEPLYDIEKLWNQKAKPGAKIIFEI